MLRACGIPAQLTYTPGGFIHGVVRFFLNGHGWVRTDATCGNARLPFMQNLRHLGYVRLFDMPIEMEAIHYAYAWPYQHNDLHGRYEFRSHDRVCRAVRFGRRGKSGPSHIRAAVKERFPHLEPGSWNKVLGSVPNERGWQDWGGLVQVSRDAVASGATGEFGSVTSKLPDLAEYVALARDFGRRKPSREDARVNVR